MGDSSPCLGRGLPWAGWDESDWEAVGSEDEDFERLSFVTIILPPGEGAAGDL